jgi:hypothetical protein
MQGLKTKTLALASLIALGISAAPAQAGTTSSSLTAAPNLDAGISGRTSGLISGGGAISSSLDVNVPASSRSRASRAKAAADSNASIDTDTGPRVKPSRSKRSSARADADTDARADSDSAPRVKAKKHRESSRTSGFSSFGASFSRRFRQR